MMMKDLNSVYFWSNKLCVGAGDFIEREHNWNRLKMTCFNLHVTWIYLSCHFEAIFPVFKIEILIWGQGFGGE